MNDSNNLIEEAKEVVIPAYNRFPIVFEKGEGVYLYDREGKKYLDFGAGIAVFAFGYHNEEYNQALKDQIDKLIHTSNLFYNEPMIEAAKKLTKASMMDKVFFTNSGAEAIEGALKLARKYAYQKSTDKEQVECNEIIAMKHSFHGRTMGALSVTGNEKYQKAFKPLIGSVKFAEFNNLESVKAQISEKTCAIIMETVQGEGGIYPATKEFLQGVRNLCNEHDIVLILDEIQCGMGRCGEMFAYQAYGIKPDIVTTAKALGCGVPVGAFVAVEKVARAFEPGDHGTTYGGNPLVTAAVSKVFSMFEEKDLVNHVKEVGAYLEEKLEALTQDYDIIKERRGMGLMQGIEFTCPVAAYVTKALEKGLILVSAGVNTIRFVPPLVITKEHVDEMIFILEDCF